jgi:hypothetical protein
MGRAGVGVYVKGNCFRVGVHFGLGMRYREFMCRSKGRI